MPTHQDDYGRPAPSDWTPAEEAAWQSYNGRRICFQLRHTPRAVWRSHRGGFAHPFPLGARLRSHRVELDEAQEEAQPPALRQLRRNRDAELAAMAEEAEFRTQRAGLCQQISQAAYLEHQVGVPRVEVTPYFGMAPPAPTHAPAPHALGPASLPDATSDERKGRLLADGFEESDDEDEEYEYDDYEYDD